MVMNANAKNILRKIRTVKTDVEAIAHDIRALNTARGYHENINLTMWDAPEASFDGVERDLIRLERSILRLLAVMGEEE